MVCKWKCVWVDPFTRSSMKRLDFIRWSCFSSLCFLSIASLFPRVFFALTPDVEFVHAAHAECCNDRVATSLLCRWMDSVAIYSNSGLMQWPALVLWRLLKWWLVLMGLSRQMKVWTCGSDQDHWVKSTCSEFPPHCGEQQCWVSHVGVC